VLTLPRVFAVLVNPAVALETRGVFTALGLRPGEALSGDRHPSIDSEISAGDLVDRLAGARNDLESPAQTLAPVIGNALALLRGTPGCRLARMSGSGATVFGLFDDCRAASAAAKLVRCAKPEWWANATLLR
jgi:4-diphosphocytidyl-2-C-methyl-D-erythritol kinase